MAGVTVIWNSPLPLAADDVPAAAAADGDDIREVDVVNEEGVKDEGMSWSPAEFAFIIVELLEVDVKTSHDIEDGDEDRTEDVTGWIVSCWGDEDEIFVLLEDLSRFPDVEDGDGDERRAWYQSRFCSRVSKIALASG